VIHGRFLHFDADPHVFEVGLQIGSHVDLVRPFKARITAEDETVLLQGYTQEFAVVAGPGATAKSGVPQGKVSNRYVSKWDFSVVHGTLTWDVFPHPFRMKEVEEYGTGNCEMV
jgi:hypothetical protein